MPHGLPDRCSQMQDLAKFRGLAIHPSNNRRGHFQIAIRFFIVNLIDIDNFKPAAKTAFAFKLCFSAFNANFGLSKYLASGQKCTVVPVARFGALPSRTAKGATGSPAQRPFDIGYPDVELRPQHVLIKRLQLKSPHHANHLKTGSYRY